MDIRNVYIIIGRKFTKKQIIDDIQSEGYKHNFFFSQGQEMDVLIRNMKMANEIWVFGDASEFEDYEYARKNRMDLWVMG